MSKSPSLRRIQADVRELLLDPSDRYHAAPLEDDMFEWHFTILGADGTDFEGGIYHGRILLPPEYPFKPPHIIFLTPSGRFETNTKICLSFSAFHPELWQPAWGIRLILEALIAFLPSPADGAIGALDWTPAERRKYAQKSIHFACPRCGKVADLLPKLDDVTDRLGSKKKSTRFEKEIEQLKIAQIANEAKNRDKSKTSTETTLRRSNSGIANGPLLEGPVDEQETVNDEERSSLSPLLMEEAAIPTLPLTEERLQRMNETIDENVANTHIPDFQEEQQLQQPVNPFEIDISWVTDSMLNVSIIVLGFICFVLVRKTTILLVELQELNYAS